MAKADPRLRIVVCEREIVGYGASGRNGGFQSAGMAGEARVFGRDGGMETVRRAERAFMDGIDWVGAVVAEEGIDCGWHKGGALRKIFDWMGIEPGVIDSAIEHLPIYGSSTHSRGTGGAVDWKPVEADGSFDPTSRPLDWTEAQKRVFARTCGEANRRQGYPDR